MEAPRIAVSNDIHFGQPCVAGTRIPVYCVLELIEAGNLIASDRDRLLPRPDRGRCEGMRSVRARLNTQRPKLSLRGPAKQSIHRARWIATLGDSLAMTV